MNTFLKTMFVSILSVTFGVIAYSDIAIAEMIEARSKPWQLFFQDPMSPTAERVYDLNVFLLWIEGIITVFVLGLMAYICFRFSAKRNPRTRMTQLQETFGMHEAMEKPSLTREAPISSTIS